MRQSKYCNCQTSSNKEILKQNINYSYCQKCGCILLKDNEEKDIIYYTLKTKQKRLPYDLSPITIIKNMKKNTEENYPFIYEEYNINIADGCIKEKLHQSINIYMKHRKMLLLKLQKLVKTFDYCDLVFYQCLYFLDTYLSHNMTEDIGEKTLLYYLIGFFLCALKFRENDIFEPSLDAFYDLSKGIYLSIEKISYYEVLCLKEMNYNVFSYSAYDWVSQLIANGVIFNCEINKDNEIILIKGHRHSLINTINKYVIKLLLNLTAKSIFFKYAPMYMAFSLIQIAREKYLDKKLIKNQLFINLVNIYGVNYDDYQKCYEDIKNEINENNETEKDKKINDEHKRNENEIKENETKDEFEIIERTESSKNPGLNFKYKNIFVPNKIKSSNVLVHIKDINVSTNNKENNDNNKDIESTSNETVSKIKIKKDSNHNIRNLKPMSHLSIDCSTNFTKSNDDLPTIHKNNNINGRYTLISIKEESKFETPTNKNYSLNKHKERPHLKELKHIKPNKLRYNSIELNNINNINNTINESSLINKEKDNIENKKKKSRFFSNKNLDLKSSNDIDLTKINNKLTTKKLPKLSIHADELISGRIQTNIEEVYRQTNNNKNKNKIRYKLKNKIKLTLPENEIKLVNDANEMQKIS